jgi:uncharacterized protein YaiL (DUF2058 family)
MNNPFQEQLLKAGLVTNQQVKKAQQDKKKKKKQQRANKAAIDETKLQAQQAAQEKARRDRELNRKKEEQARKRAISAEINQLIISHRIERNEGCDVAYNFKHGNKVKSIYIDEVMRQQIIQGSIGIVRIEGRYELVPKSIAEKIQQRNEERIILFKEEQQIVDENDPYAEYQIPDDLMW